MSKKQEKSIQAFMGHPGGTECPFREFKDSEFSPEFWGMGTAAYRTAVQTSLKDKTVAKHPIDAIWIDEQIQPLPRSVRYYLSEWIRADELAMNRWEAEVVIFEDNESSKITANDYLFNHMQVLLRSSFCRRVLSTCFVLEKAENLIVEHQWDGFIFNFGVEGWRAKFHIYSPGLKAGGGPQHRPVISKNGCYLVRLFYLGVWRCVWVNDQVPIDASGAPLLPFSPILPRVVAKPQGKQPFVQPTRTVQLWPLLLCKALLKIAAPDMHELDDSAEDEDMNDFNIFHVLTGSVSLTWKLDDIDDMWQLIGREVPHFSWDDDDETVSSVMKSKAAKKPATKDTSAFRASMTTILIADTKDEAAYMVPGVTPSHEMVMLITAARDIPIKKPLPEPDVPLWKTYRWVEWAKHHGLYEAYDCPRTKFIKCDGLLKTSYAPHMLDVHSAESITFTFKEMEKGKKSAKDILTPSQLNMLRIKDEIREWVLFKLIFRFIKSINVNFFPSMLQFVSATSCVVVHPNKGSNNKCIDLVAPKYRPLYVQIDSPEQLRVQIAFSVMHPRVLSNCRAPISEYLEPGYLFLERFNWFDGSIVPIARVFLQTRSYDSAEVTFPPGRHFCRLWVQSHLHWQTMLVTESNLLMGNRDQIMVAACQECPWAIKFLCEVGTTFTTWMRGSKSTTHLFNNDREKEFYRSYFPDLEWDKKVVGYPRSNLHWMFRRALQVLLLKRLTPNEYRNCCVILRKLFNDPEFGLPIKPAPPKNYRKIISNDICDCGLGEEDKLSADDEMKKEMNAQDNIRLNNDAISVLLRPSVYPRVSQLCELSSDLVPCSDLRIARDRILRKHDAATLIQSHWRRVWVQKCLRSNPIFTPELQKAITDSAFGNTEALSALMNQFFSLYPGVRTAYSVASALSGVHGLQQFTGVAPVTTKCKWIPFFQTVFFCHCPVKVTFDLRSTVHHQSFSVYNNDTALQMNQAGNAPLTYDFSPNCQGFTITGYGLLEKPVPVAVDASWQFSVLAAEDGVFHMCNSTDMIYCVERPIQVSTKMHIDELFLPNRRHVLGGIHLTVSKFESVCFRAAASFSEMEMEITLRSTDAHDEVEVLDRCRGKGEVFWPLILLEGPPSEFVQKRRSSSHANLLLGSLRDRSDRTVKSAKTPKISSAKHKTSIMKMDFGKQKTELKHYIIEVTAPKGWPLSLAQWTRIEEHRNAVDVKPEGVQKKMVKDRIPSAKEKDSKIPIVGAFEPLPGDAYVELEISLVSGGGVVAKRDDERDMAFAEAKRLWNAQEPGRNMYGAQLRKEFLDEYLVQLPPATTATSASSIEDRPFGDQSTLHSDDISDDKLMHAPTPASDIFIDDTMEAEEEPLYLELPEQLKNKFLPLTFVPSCTKEDTGERVFITPEKAEAAKTARNARIEAALERMRELQQYNEVHIIGRQKRRSQLMEKVYVDALYSNEIYEAFDARDEVVALEGFALDQRGKKK